MKYYSRALPDWREQIRKNEYKTRWVVFTFIALYLLLGLLIDVFRYSQVYYLLPYGDIFIRLISFQTIPTVTLITTSIAIISLWVVYSWHNRIMLMGTQYKEIKSNQQQDMMERQLYNVVEELKIAAGMRYMPRVFIIDADYMNAFASGYSEKSAMVAITRGLLQKLDRAELEAVMAHEISHIRHHDIKLTLMVTVLSNLMLIVVDILFYSILFGNRNRRNDNKLVMIILLLRYLLPVVTVLLSLYLSRTREYMADAGCVELTRNNDPLARALIKINDDHQQHSQEYTQAYAQTAHEEVRRAAYIFDPVKAGIRPSSMLSAAFSTHPSLSDRLKALGFKLKK